MAVYRSSGDGYVLYGAVKLQNLPTLESVEEPHYVILKDKYDQYLYLLVSSSPFAIEDNIIDILYDGKVADFYLYPQDEEPFWEKGDEWDCLVGELQTYIRENSCVLVWTSHDITDSVEEKTYYATTPIPLDGMKVIEWNGDITQGWEDGEGIWENGDGTVVVAPYAKASNAIAVFSGELCTEFSSWGDLWEVYNNNEDSEHYEVCAVVAEPLYGSVCARYYDEQLYTSLIAYTPVEEPTTVDYTITYETEHGTAPTSKTVTVNEGESYTLTADDLPTLEADGYTFKGWSANVGDTISADTTLTAVWEIIPADLPEWTSGDGWALYGGLKFPAVRDSSGYMVLGYSKSKARYELILSEGKLSYGTKTYQNEGEAIPETATGFVFSEGGIASRYYLDGNEWSQQKKGEQYIWDGNQGSMMLGSSVFTIEETVWANFDILNYNDSTETLYTYNSYVDRYRSLEGYDILEWDGNTHGLTKVVYDGYQNYYRVSGLTLPSLKNLRLNKSSLPEVWSLIAGTSDGKHSNMFGSCWGHGSSDNDDAWIFWELGPLDFVYYAETANEVFPEAGLYFYNDGTDRTTLFAFKVVKGWLKQDTYKDGVKHDDYRKTSNGWVKCDTYRYKDEVEE